MAVAIQTRPARPDDIDRIADFNRRLAQETENTQLDAETVRR